MRAAMHAPAMKRLIQGLLFLCKKGLPGSVYHFLNYRYLRAFGHDPRPGETSKAKARREREGFFDAYCRGRGLDVGHGGDPVAPGCDLWEYEDGDAHLLAGVADATYDFVYSSNTLEHLLSPRVALKSWWRVLKPGGYLILYVPDRELFEKTDRLPSRWAGDHLHFFLVDRDEAPDTIGLVPLMRRVLTDLDIVYAKVCDEGYANPEPETLSEGEYCIEVVARKTA